MARPLAPRDGQRGLRVVRLGSRGEIQQGFRFRLVAPSGAVEATSGDGFTLAGKDLDDGMFVAVLASKVVLTFSEEGDYRLDWQSGSETGTLPLRVELAPAAGPIH